MTFAFVCEHRHIWARSAGLCDVLGVFPVGLHPGSGDGSRPRASYDAKLVRGDRTRASSASGSAPMAARRVLARPWL